MSNARLAAIGWLAGSGVAVAICIIAGDQRAAAVMLNIARVFLFASFGAAFAVVVRGR